MDVFAEYYSRKPVPPVELGTYVCTGPVGSMDLDGLRWQIEALREAAEGKRVEELFMCLISPGWLQGWIWNEHYGSEEEFIFALAEAVKPYYKAIVDAGMILQIDSPDIVDTWSWERWNDVRAYRKHLEMAPRGDLERDQRAARGAGQAALLLG